jgi:hypothetical protein
MHGRCSRAYYTNYPRYGGRGITVCDRWKHFEAFLEDMGERPQGTTLGRIDHDKGYEPSNCEWQTSAQQAENRGRGWERVLTISKNGRQGRLYGRLGTVIAIYNFPRYRLLKCIKDGAFRSVLLVRCPGAKRGTRLIDLESLDTFLAKFTSDAEDK